MPALELVFALGHALFVKVDLGQDDVQQAAQRRYFRLLNQLIGRPDEGDGRGRRFDTCFTQNAAQQVDPLGTAFLSGFPQPVQLLKLLLVVALHRDRMDIAATRRFQHGVAIIAVGFVTAAIGSHVARMQRLHLMPSDCANRPQ